MSLKFYFWFYSIFKCNATTVVRRPWTIVCFTCPIKKVELWYKKMLCNFNIFYIGLHIRVDKVIDKFIDLVIIVVNICDSQWCALQLQRQTL